MRSETIPRPARWGIVATIDEPASLIAAWVAYHLTIGASEIHIFFDRPNSEARSLLEGMSGVFLHASGEDGWRGLTSGRRPGRHQARQAYNATRILNETTLDWLVHCDADEFLRVSDPLGDELANVPDNIEWLLIEVQERVWTGAETEGDIFAGAFRLPLADFELIGPGLYGAARAMRMNAGLSGHDVGKACVRAGRGHVMNIHRPARHRHSKRCDLRFAKCRSACLTHFNGMTRLQYIMKMLRRGLVLLDGLPSPSSAARKQQFETALSHAGDAEALNMLWQDMQYISAEELEILKELEAIRFDDLNIAEIAQKMFQNRLRLNPADFDRTLIAYEAAAIGELVDRLGFAPDAVMAEVPR
ncbi:glycosyltransferase family 2 protein [Paracoccus albus]|uniref:glycosyltransferase family 2 protein n=1 Tax=Paracoccus albus TaxID=3017784 RepID=UPI0022F01160|nr:glycosyltransferase family 2 protein [Paracoccus albus]WBU60946.1 glycosyltransferase family 2 protein [Paracoccus albus]